MTAGHNPPRISAVIPTYNRAEVVVRAVESAQQQTVQPVEIIVVDDGSTDDTALRLAAFGDSITYIRQQNAGAAAARNRGVAEASGNWIAFLDSDDFWVANHLERVGAAIAATDGRAVMYFSDVDWDGGTAWGKSDFTIPGSHELIDDGSGWLLRSSHPCLMPGTVMRRDAILAAGGFKEGMTVREDSHLFFRMGLGAPLCAVAGVGAVATADGRTNRLTSKVRGGTLEYSDRTLELYRDAIAAKPDLRREHRRALRQRLASAYVTRAGLLWAAGKRIVALAWLGRGIGLDPIGTARRTTRRAVKGRMTKS